MEYFYTALVSTMKQKLTKPDLEIINGTLDLANSKM